MIEANIAFGDKEIPQIGEVYNVMNLDYLINRWSTSHTAESFVPYGDPDYRIFEDEVCQYGVADSLEQIVAHMEPLRAHGKAWAVSAVRVDKADQPAFGGWRWSKWGPYIGEKKPESSYLADEPVIDSVWCFHVVEVRRHPGE